MSNAIVPPLAAPFVKASDPTDGEHHGIVVKIDGTSVTLDNGRIYTASSGSDLTRVAVGARVVVVNPQSLQGADIVPEG